MFGEIVSITVEGITHNIWYLATGILMAAGIEAYLDRSRAMSSLSKSGWIGILLGTAVGALTPLCSCGTAAVILALIASGVPWPPVVSFLVSSPLMSPSDYMLTAGVLGSSMANAKLATAIALGLASGAAAFYFERKGLLVNTAAEPPAAIAGGSCCCTADCDDIPTSPSRCRGGDAPIDDPCSRAAYTPAARFLRALRTQAWFILKYFVLFSFLGAVTQVIVPESWVRGLFGRGGSYSVISASLLGIPLYMSCTASIPFTASLMRMGMSKGAALAFLTSGPGTHLGALAAVGLIAPRRVWWLYIGTIFLGSVVAGLLYGLP